ncbi:MAG: hypothetical protein Hyperionvirus17_17 [Hyperionvirus sp.]|uniref:Uncharacterized protein n=1 Tax=Hyperionvirus sp. TaxID=2487770 RepID=A0A3G5AA13_9VIRU|nr:MAG: hypothetical protein Hyperionvirus17_17 [Hyperionvirus sp.]
MFYNYLKIVYTSLEKFSAFNNRASLQNIISDNENFLNLLAHSSMGGGAFDPIAVQERMKKEVFTAVEDLLKRCGNTEDVKKIVSALQALLRYIDSLYSTVKNVDLITVHSQLKELNDFVRTYSA